MLIRRIALATVAILMSINARADPVTFGPGDDPPARVEITVRRAEVTMHGASASSSSLTRTFVGAIDRAPSGVRRMTIRLTQVGGEGVADDEIVRLSGDVEIYLFQSLKEVEVVLAFDSNGLVTSLDNWEEVRAKLAENVERRVAALQTEHPVIHAVTSLSADAVEQLHRQVAKGFVELIRNMSSTDFFQTFYLEPGLILIASNERLQVGDTMRRSGKVRNPSDGRAIVTTERYRLRELDARRTRAVLDVLPDDSVEAMLREGLVKTFREQKLDEEDIRQRVEAMALRWESDGTAEVDVSSGRMRHIILDNRLHVGAYDYRTHEEITFAPIP